MRRRKWVIILIVAASLLALFATVCSWSWWAFGEFLQQACGRTATRNIVRYSLQVTNDLLKAVETYQDGRIPTESSLYYGGRHCWKFVQDAMARNDNRYMLNLVAIWGRGGTPSPFSSDDVLVDVLFSDGSRVRTQFYNGVFEGCTGFLPEGE
jgi:hypothetical protein